MGPASSIYDCADGDAAIEAAKRALDGHDIETWEGARLVLRLSRGDGNKFCEDE
jgi:hypothetical protein